MAEAPLEFRTSPCEAVFPLFPLCRRSPRVAVRERVAAPLRMPPALASAAGAPLRPTLPEEPPAVAVRLPLASAKARTEREICSLCCLKGVREAVCAPGRREKKLDRRSERAVPESAELFDARTIRP